MQWSCATNEFLPAWSCSKGQAWSLPGLQSEASYPNHLSNEQWPVVLPGQQQWPPWWLTWEAWTGSEAIWLPQGSITTYNNIKINISRLDWVQNNSGLGDVWVLFQCSWQIVINCWYKFSELALHYPRGALGKANNLSRVKVYLDIYYVKDNSLGVNYFLNSSHFVFEPCVMYWRAIISAHPRQTSALYKKQSSSSLSCLVVKHEWQSQSWANLRGLIQAIVTTECMNSVETLPDGVYVGQTHELYVTTGVVL